MRRYFYDSDAIRESVADGTAERYRYAFKAEGKRIQMAEMHHGKGYCTAEAGEINAENGRNKRSVWTMTTRGFTDAHFATFPEELPRTCILAGSAPGDIVLDPFAGAATQGAR